MPHERRKQMNSLNANLMAATAAAAATMTCADEAPAQKPNIIFIVADQWRGDCLGLYRNEHPVMTPHLNQLASEGVLFTQAYADCPICMPQRVTMLTGRTGSQLCCLANFPQIEFRPDFDMQQTLPARLSREAGYQTKAIGKMHFCPPRSRYGFEHVTLMPDDYLWWLQDMGYDGTFRAHGLGGNEVYPGVAPVPEKFYHTTWIVNEGLRFLQQRDPEHPFFLYMVFEAPHSPFDPPPPYDRMYDNFTIPNPVSGDWSQSDREPAEFAADRLSDKWDHLSPEMIREARRRYYGQISQVDYQLGLLFGELRTRKLLDNTIIVFTSDHGELLGDHGLFAKHNFLQASYRVPLILRVPDRPEWKAIERTAPVQTADLCPTLLELAGLPPDPSAEGRSLLPLLNQSEAFAGRTVFGEVSYGCASALNDRYKYIYYADNGCEQLFDLKTDPNDLHNQASNPELQKELAGLRQQLITYLAKNGSGLVKDGKLIARERKVDVRKERPKNKGALRGKMYGSDGY